MTRGLSLAQRPPAQAPATSHLTVNGVIIRSLKVNCKVTSRFAHYVITSQVANTADTAKEVVFDVEIPKTAFISDFAMCVSCLAPTPRTSHSPGPTQDHSSEWPESTDRLLISPRAAGHFSFEGRNTCLGLFWTLVVGL